MIEKEIKYCYNDLTVVPEVISDISSRSECNPFENDMLPIFASPMSTIVNDKNINIWKSNYITPIIPRNINYYDRINYCNNNEWVAFSLSEFKRLFIDEVKQNNAIYVNKKFKVCIDLANGHMRSLYESINEAKELANKYNYKLTIMTGNIANPETYKWICENAVVDYIRISIGTGNNCLTATQTSTYYPIASLIYECYNIKKSIIDNINNYKSCPFIIADGGVRGYADIIKALGLGADYVMVGSLFTGLLESAAPLDIECYNSHYKYVFKDDGTVNNGIIDILNIWNNCNEDTKRTFLRDMKSVIKESYGMSTKKAQKLINPSSKTKTSEGCTKYITVKETIHQWTDNMIAYLRSAMSYTNKKTIFEFKGNVNFVINSAYSIASINK